MMSFKGLLGTCLPVLAWDVCAAALLPAVPGRVCTVPVTTPSTGEPVFIDIENPGFEADAGWTGLNVRSIAYDAPVDGRQYAVLAVDDATLRLRTEVRIEAGMEYELTLWARSVHDEEHMRALAAPAYEALPVHGSSARARARVALGTAERSLVHKDVDVSPSALIGDAATVPGDDGANILVDGRSRVQFNDVLLHQPVTSDPITDPWMVLDRDGHDADMALGVVSVPGGRRFVLDCYYEDDPPIGGTWHSLITVRELSGSPTDYRWGERRAVLEHECRSTGGPREQLPWVIDPHAYWDAEDGRLWLSWGGHDLYVTELDPDSGRAIGVDGRIVDADLGALDPRIMDDPVHTMVVRQQAERSPDDPWRRSTYQEGPAMHRHGGFFYYFMTSGHLAYDYTIRVGRSVDPRGPYLDRDGRPLLAGGGSILLGDDTDQLVPGHPHVWEEDGAFFLGYDYRTRRSGEDDAIDLMGIRRLHWVDGWPTIWRPISVTLRADEHPVAIGQLLEIAVVNVGDDGSSLAVDRVRLRRAPVRVATPTRRESP